jgi:hypothetical protein
MVGVPGRSNACGNCRSMKKGCDGARPRCTRCIKGKRQCDGYEKQYVFLNQAQESTAPIAYRRRDKTDEQPTSAQVVQQHRAPHITVPDVLARSAYLEKCFQVFLGLYLPFNHHNTSLCCLDIVLARQAESAIKYGFLALSLCVMGQRDGDSRLLQAGLQSYTHTVREVTQLLRQGRERSSYRVLWTATMLLALFDMMFNTTQFCPLQRGRTWLGHMDGQIAMTLSKTPRDFQLGHDHKSFTLSWRTFVSVFRSLYTLMLIGDSRIKMISAISRRKRCVLDGSEWRTVPWEHIPKSPRDQLVDIWGDISGIMEDTDVMLATPHHEQKETLRMDIVCTCWMLHTQLRDWLRTNGPLTVFQDGPGPTSGEDLILADLCVSYWTTCLLLYEALWSVMDDNSTMSADTNPVTYVRLILAALPYFWSPDAGMMGQQIVAFPLGGCLQMIHLLDHSNAADRALVSSLIPFLQAKNTAVVGFLSGLSFRSLGSDQNFSVRAVPRLQTWLRDG